MIQEPDSPPELTLEEKNKILEFLQKYGNEKFSLKKLVEFVAGPDCDYRSEMGRLIRKYLQTEGLQKVIDEKKEKRERDLKKEIPTELTPAQKEFVDKNGASMKFTEMAQVLFNNNKLAGFSPEVKLIVEYVKSKETAKLYEDPDNVATDKYTPPNAYLTVIQKINKYVLNNPYSSVSTVNVKKFTEDLNPKLKACLDALLGYLHSFQFLYQINSYGSISERELFENSYIGFLYSKPDVTQEELSQYIDLCSETVNLANLQTHINKLQFLIDQATEGEDPGVRMSLVESLDNAREERHKIATRKKQLLDSLTVKRKDKLLAEQSQNASMIQLIEYWRDSTKRDILLKAAKERSQQIKTEIGRLKDMDDLKVEIWGISPEEIIGV